MKKLTIDKATLDLLFETAKSTIAKSEERPILNYIKVEVTESTLTAITLDGYRLSKFTIPHSQKTEAFDCYIKPFAIPKTLDTAEIEKTETAAAITLHCLGYDLTYSFAQPTGGTFPDYTKLLPNTDDTLEVFLDAKMLIETLKPFAKLPERFHCVRFSFVRTNDGINKITPVLLSRDKHDCNIQTIVLPIRQA